MSTEQQAAEPAEQPAEQPAQQQGWGAPQPPPPKRPQWTTKRTVIAVAVAVGIAVAGGGVIWAASGSADERGRGAPQGGMIIGGPGPMGGDQAQHGEFQNGEVTEIDDKAITVKSEDGFTETYQIDSDTLFPTGADNVETGDKVNVMATDGTAVSVVENDDSMRPPGGGPGQRRAPN